MFTIATGGDDTGVAMSRIDPLDKNVGQDHLWLEPSKIDTLFYHLDPSTNLWYTRGMRATPTKGHTTNNIATPQDLQIAPHKLIFAEKLRAHPTRAEEWVWGLLEERSAVWYRQVCMCGYIVDFYNPTIGLVMEIDGSSHVGREEYDAQREATLIVSGYKIIRFTNAEVFGFPNRDILYEAIFSKLRNCG